MSQILPFLDDPLCSSALQALGDSAPPATTLRYRVTLITPMMGGGVEAGVVDAEQPFRARALRGVLRFWWRVVATSHKDQYNSAELRRRELDLWGGLTSDDDDAGGTQASQVGIRIEQVKAKRPISYASLPEETKKTLKYGLFALLPAENQDTPALLPAGAQFELHVSVRHPEALAEVKSAVRYWASFGGLGARTRRGFGAVSVEGLNEHPARIQNRLNWSELGDLKNLPKGMSYKTFTLPGGLMSGVLLVPAKHQNAQAQLGFLLKALQAFRQQTGFAREGSQKNPGLSRWPEAHSIRRQTGMHSRDHPPPASTQGLGSAPRAGFGLPLCVDFRKDGANRPGQPGRDPVPHTLLPPGAERMASPLILRPMHILDENNRVVCVSAAISLDVARLEGLDGPLLPRVTLHDTHDHSFDLPTWPDTWANGAPAPLAKAINGPPCNPARNVVQAFLNHLVQLSPEGEIRP